MYDVILRLLNGLMENTRLFLLVVQRKQETRKAYQKRDLLVFHCVVGDSTSI